MCIVQRLWARRTQKNGGKAGVVGKKEGEWEKDRKIGKLNVLI